MLFLFLQKYIVGGLTAGSGQVADGRGIRRASTWHRGGVRVRSLLAACTLRRPRADVDLAAPDVGVQLFQLPWTSIAEECENDTRPDGFAWVLTSPPQEHVDARRVVGVVPAGEL